MSDHLKFIKAEFEMQTGKTAKCVSQIGFSEYIIETDDGEVFRFRG